MVEEDFGPISSLLYAWVTSFGFMRSFHQFIVSQMSCSSGPILDVGMGPGVVPIRFLERNRSSWAIGLDPSVSMLKIAQKRGARSGVYDRLEAVRGTSTHLPCRSSSLGTIIASLSFHHWGRRRESLQEVRRVLRPGGRFYVYEFHPSVAGGLLGILARSHTMDGSTFVRSSVGSGFVRAETLKVGRYFVGILVK